MLLCKLKSVSNNSSYFFQKWKRFEELAELYKRLYMEEVSMYGNNWIQVVEYDNSEMPSDGIYRNCKGYFCDQSGHRLKAIPIYFSSRDIADYKKLKK